MANAIKIADSAWHSQRVSLSGNTYTIVQKYNPRDEGWYIDITNSNGESLYGLKLMPNQNITARYRYRDILVGGDLWVVRVQNDTTPINRDNLGINKTYELWWVTYEEQEAYDLNGKVQLR